MPTIGHGIEICTSATRPLNASLGTMIFQTDTNEHLHFVNGPDGTARWMQPNPTSNRNVLINGEFLVWQRGTTINAGGGGATTYGADRWCFGNNGTARFSLSRRTGIPLNRFLHSARMTATTSDANGLNGFEQYIEQLNVLRLRGRRVTLSFWIRGNKSFSGALYVQSGTTADQNPGNGNAFTGATNLISETVNITTSWQYVSFTSSSGVPGTANVMRVGLPRPTFLINDWYEVAGVQLETGTAPSDFEQNNYSDVLLSCQRYYAASLSSTDYFANTYFYGAGANNLYKFGIGVSFPTTMRIVPDLSVSFTNLDNSSNQGQTVHIGGFTQYYRNGNSSFPYCAWRATYSANAEI